ncbi:MAG: GxxExxY protein [Flavobacteriales bacterium]|nr:GxxExxY protein [Flavobacteriales bacterium]
MASPINYDRMEGEKLIFKQETEAILGAAFEVMNVLGPGLFEKPYERALCIEFELRGIPFIQQPQYEVLYKGRNVGKYIPDIVVFDRIVVDTKVIDDITKQEQGQMINYLQLTALPVGLIINFKRTKLDWKRMVL